LDLNTDRSRTDSLVPIRNARKGYGGAAIISEVVRECGACQMITKIEPNCGAPDEHGITGWVRVTDPRVCPAENRGVVAHEGKMGPISSGPDRDRITYERTTGVFRRSV